MTLLGGAQSQFAAKECAGITGVRIRLRCCGTAASLGQAASAAGRAGGHHDAGGDGRDPYGTSAEQRKQLTDLVVAATRTKSWQDALAKNGWTPALLAGKAFEDFVDAEFASLRATMHLSGML